MRDTSKQFRLEYLDADQVGAYLEVHSGHILNVIGFGRRIALPETPLTPLWVDIPVLNGSASTFEVWTSNEPVTPCAQHGICGMTDGEVLFASIALEQRPGETLERLTSQAYMRIFALIDQFGYRNLLRVWHYIPRINDDENGLERYRGFNVGRHAAFVANGRSTGEEDAPAASVLGSNGGPSIFYFMAGKRPGQAVENPRQVSAYHYPQSLGPRSPIFVRAMSCALGGQDCFFISGTASIVGYETLHHGDAEKQAAETLLNVRTLLQQIPRYDPARGRMLLKVYLRNTDDLPMVRDKVQAEFGTRCRTVYLQSNICRSDLLLEIEGAYFNEAKQDADFMPEQPHI